MRIAVLADIHGNHVALEQCLRYIEDQKIDTYIFLGDYVGEMPYPQITMKILYKLSNTKQSYFISGNKEDYWINYKNSGEKGWMDYHSVTGSLLYSYRNLKEEDISFMEKLNKMIHLKLEGMPAIKLVHIPPYKELDSKEIHEISIKKQKVDGTVILCGHRHIQGQIEYEGCSYINPGSVGVSLYSNGKAQFAIMDYNDGYWNIDYISLEYDVEKVIREIYEVKLDQHAPCWTRMSIDILKGSCLSHAYGLNRAMEITKGKYGECVWPNIPEECFEQAVSEMENICGIEKSNITS